ncbi:MAG: glycosyltransferase, partial [Candidatus Pacebacteria bacterium]|nr:glycosyltransferase [Candidatus Paceibacterota bacterium]
SKFFNFVTSLFSRVQLHDFNCGFKAYRCEVAKSLDLYGQLHRYIPVIARNQGYKIAEIPIHHRKRKFGRSKYGPIRFLNGFLDLLTVMMLTKYFKRPAHFFGGLGSIALIIGFFIGLYITYLRLFTGSIQSRLPLFIAGILLIMVGFQLLSLGLIGEMFVKNYVKEDESLKTKKIIKN